MEIYCISIDKCEDRRKHFKSYFSNIPFKFLIVKKHQKGGVYGCFHSHISIIKDVYKRGIKNVLIFEDDAYPTSYYSKENFEKIDEFLKKNVWDCFYLGYFAFGINKKNDLLFKTPFFNGNICQFNPMSSHAYILNRKGMKKILDRYERFIGICHFDYFLSGYADLKSYCFLPMLIDQNYSFNYQIEPLNIIEYILRKLYPLFNLFKIHQIFSILIYYRFYLIIILLYLFYRYGRTRFYI